MKFLSHILVEDYVWTHRYLLTCSLKKFMMVRFILAFVSTVLFTVVYFIKKDSMIVIVGWAMTLFLYMYPFLQLKKYQKRKQEEVEVAMTQWILQLEPLILTNTIPVAIQKSISIAPKSIVEEVTLLSERILIEPVNKQHYLDFCQGYQTSDIVEAMLSLHQYNFSDKDEILLDFQLLHKRIDDLRCEAKKKQNEEKIFFYGMILIAEPFLTMLWVLEFVMLISSLMMKHV